MTALKDGGSAFPITVHMEGHDRYSEGGMTLRDYFAAKAMEGWMAGTSGRSSGHEVETCADRIAATSYIVADAMLKARAA